MLSQEFLRQLEEQLTVFPDQPVLCGSRIIRADVTVAGALAGSREGTVVIDGCRYSVFQRYPMASWPPEFEWVVESWERPGE